MPSPVFSPWHPSPILHCKFPILPFSQCERPNFLSCFYNILPFHAQLPWQPLLHHWMAKCPSEFSQRSINEELQRVADGWRQTELAPASREHAGWCGEPFLPLPMQADSWCGIRRFCWVMKSIRTVPTHTCNKTIKRKNQICQSYKDAATSTAAP